MSGKLITNQETNLSDLFASILPKTKDLCFLVGYFYFSGFPEICNNIKDNKMRILVGLDIDVDLLNNVREYEELNKKKNSKSKEQHLYYERLVKLFNNTNFFDNVEKQEAFRIFYEKIKDGSLELRKTAEPNHAKMYLFEESGNDPTLPGHMIVGSSNLSLQGLKNRNELNVVFHDVDYNEGKQLFDKLWETGIPIADKNTIVEFEKNVIEKIWYDKIPSPYLVYLRVLKEFFEIHPHVGSFRTPHMINPDYNDFEYQVDAIKGGLDKIARHNGVIIADVVGLGKSVIASAIAANMDVSAIVVITPPHLKTQWEAYCQEFGIWYKTHIYTNGKIEDAVKDFANTSDPFLVIIDEAHKYRNAKSNDYAKLHQLCSGNKVILLTATPYNNRPQDIYSLLRLFQIPGKSTLKNVENLGSEFERLITEYKKIEKNAKQDDLAYKTFSHSSEAQKIAKQILNLIAPVVIRRSRKDLEIISRYKKDLEKQNIAFPKVQDPEVKEYDLGNMETKYIQTLDMICEKDLDDTPLESELQHYKAARYKPLQYIKADRTIQIREKIEKEGLEFDFFQRSQTNLANFMRRLLIHRFESSIRAFEISLRHMIEASENIVKWIEHRKTIPIYKRGDLPDIESLIESSDDTGPDILGNYAFEEQIQKLNSRGLFEIDIDDICTDYIDDINADISLLREIYNNWFGENGQIDNDPKLDSFYKEISGMLKRDPQRKIIIFTEFADTADYLTASLENRNVKVFGYTSRKASLQNKELIRRNFDAGVPSNLQQNDYSVLVATDAISEGYNLHRAGTIFNYDIPYNPTRVIQRIGRINRINKKVFDELYIYNYFPSVVGEKDVKVKRITTIKMRMINAIMGGDMKVLTKDEELCLSGFNKEFRELEDASEEKSWDAEYREEWEQAKNTEAYSEAMKICHRTKIARESSTRNGILIFGKRGDECIFKWTNKTDGTIETVLPENALPVLKAEATESAEKVSSSFYKFYNNLKNNLFSSTARTLSTTRGKALNKVRAFLNENNPQDEEYLTLLKEIIEVDGIPDYSKIMRAKTCDDLQRYISLQYLEKVKSASEKIDEEPENVILAEEFL
jgi:superfamily II DNA or RNA helicase